MKEVTISRIIQTKLVYIVLFALVTSTAIIFAFNTHINTRNYESIIAATLTDVEKDIDDTSDINMLAQILKIKGKLLDKFAINNAPNVDEMNEYLRSIAKDEVLSEMSLVNKDNIIVYSSINEYIGFDMNIAEETRVFDNLNHGATEIIQPVRANAYKGSGEYDEYNKYAGVPFENIGYLQIGISAKEFQKQIDEKVVYIAENRHIGQTGYVIISNENDIVISNANGINNVELATIGLKVDKNDRSEKTFYSNINGIEHLCITKFVEGYYITGVVPMEEVQSFRDRAMKTNVIIEFIILAFMFIFIDVSIRDDIVSKIQNINKNLHEIIKGQLDTKIDEYSSKEFYELSTDINSTVKTLKEYSEKEKENIKKELEFAKSIQMSVLPKIDTMSPYSSNFELCATINTAKEVGGDFYDFYMIDNNHLAILIADVSGKGVPAAMFMMTCKTMIKNYVESGLSLDSVFNKVNEELCNSNDANMFVTVWMGIIDLKKKSLIYVNAGHNQPIITNDKGELEYVNCKPGFVLTGIPGKKYELQEQKLKKGSMIYLYTDGVTEANNNNQDMYGEERLINCLNKNKDKKISELLSSIKSDMDDFVKDAEQFDDITMLCVRIN